MVVENGITNDPEKVGYYSGVIESIYAFTGVLAGIISWLLDLIGFDKTSL